MIKSLIHSFLMDSRTVLPLPSISSSLAPAFFSKRMTSLWSFRASNVPVPPRPVSCTARYKGVEPFPFLKLTSAPFRSKTSTAPGHLCRTALCNGVTPSLLPTFGFCTGFEQHTDSFDLSLRIPIPHRSAIGRIMQRFRPAAIPSSYISAVSR